MQIVIDIPETDYADLHYKIYKMAEREGLFDDEYKSQKALVFKAVLMILDAIKNGVVLPNGHGRLISADLLIEQYKEYCKANCKYTEKQRNVMCRACATGDTIEMLENTPTVLETDKESKEL